MFKKGQDVFYFRGDDIIRGRVITAHRDGTITLKALFYQTTEKVRGDYLGYIYKNLPVEDMATTYTGAVIKQARFKLLSPSLNLSR